MKKVFLSLAVVGLISFTSCKKTAEAAADTVEAAADETVENVEATGDAVAGAAGDVADATEEVVTGVPQFESEEVQKFVDEYNTFYKEMKDAASSGDATKLQELTEKSQEWATKMQDVLANLSEEDKAKLTEWSTNLAKEAMGQ